MLAGSVRCFCVGFAVERLQWKGSGGPGTGGCVSVGLYCALWFVVVLEWMRDDSHSCGCFVLERWKFGEGLVCFV